MRYRQFGRTGLEVSEVGFGAWPIGGQSYGAVDQAEALRALAVAEDLGCNLVDTAGVYGDSEHLIGRFLAGRRDRWIIASKYSAQPEGLVRTVDAQLRRMGLETIDFYQLHWVPRRGEDLFDALQGLKASGKIRYAGVSLYTAADIERVLQRNDLDGFQVACSLLDPEPLVPRARRVRAAGLAVLVRSALRLGFLSGKYDRNVRFPDPRDQRRTLTRRQITGIVGAVQQFRFLETAGRPLLVAAARYPLSLEGVSTVLLGTKTTPQARVNFGEVPEATLDANTLEAVRLVQSSLGLFGDSWGRAFRAVRRLVSGGVGSRTR